MDNTSTSTKTVDPKKSAASKKAAETRKKNALKKKRQEAAKKGAETKRLKKLANTANAQVGTVDQIPPTVIPTKKLLNRVGILIDQSGSMSNVRQKAVDCANDTINTLRKEDAKGDTETEVSLFFFSESYATDGFKRIFENQNIKTVKDVTLESYNPQGGTPLRDALSQTIDAIQSDNPDMSFVLVCITDGAENASRNITPEQLREKIQKLQGTDRWTFACLVPEDYINTFKVATGVPAGNVKGWGDIQVATTATVQGMSAFYASRRSGQRSVQKFFTDLSKLDPVELAKLPDIHKNVKIWTVEKEMPIQAFVESKHGSFEPGKSYYQLTKQETVQDYKDILLMEKNAPRGAPVYENVRPLLGLPTTGDAKLVPHNHGTYELFVKSTSNNRCLVRGTKLIYRI